MNKYELKEYIINIFNNNVKGKFCLHIKIAHDINLKNDIILATNNLKNVLLSQRCWHILNDILEFPTCKNCNKNTTKWNHNKWSYCDFCSQKCAGIFNKNKNIKTCQEKYGVDNYSQTNQCKLQYKETCMEKYGVPYYQQTNESKIKSKETCQEKYGVNNYIQTPEFKEKSKETCMEKYGVPYYQQTEEFKTKYKNTCLKKYGVTSGLEINRHISLLKRKYTWFNKYGVYNVMQNTEISTKSFHNGFKLKEYVLPSGKIVKIQGYENKFLDEYFLNNEESNILIDNKEIENTIGQIWYISSDGKKHRYFPDMYLIKENKIIEVKSIWTIKKDPIIIELKKQACLNIGFNYEFKIYK